MAPRLLQRALRAQGVYYLATALWALLSPRSFVAVVGPKPDRFQFHSTTVLIAVIGAALALASRKPVPNETTVALAAGSALSLGAVEAYHWGRIRPVFGLDLVAEVVLAAVVLSSYFWTVRGRSGGRVVGPGSGAAPVALPRDPGF